MFVVLQPAHSGSIGSDSLLRTVPISAIPLLFYEFCRGEECSLNYRTAYCHKSSCISAVEL